MDPFARKHSQEQNYQSFLSNCPQEYLNYELKKLVDKDPAIETNVTNLANFLKNEQWKQLEEIMQILIPPNDFSPPHPKIINYNQVSAVEHLFQNPTGQLNYLQLLITHFEIENVLFGRQRYAPIHYAVEALDEKFLDWLLQLKDANGRNLVDVNIRNKDKKTALYMLCEKYDKGNLTSQQREKIIKLIDRLLEAGADFNIYSGPKQLPFDLLLKHYDNDSAIKQFVDRYDSQSNRAIAYSVCRENGSNERIVIFYDNGGNRNVHVTPELLELFLQLEDLKNFDQHWRILSVNQTNVKKVIELVLQVAVTRKLDNSVCQIVNDAKLLIFGKREGKPELEHRFELKELLLSAIQAGNLVIIELLLLAIQDDKELVNYEPVLAQTLEKAHFTRQKQDDSDRFLNCADYLIKSKVVSLSKTTSMGNTPLHLATMYGFEDIAFLLLKSGCGSLCVCNHAYLTPLEYGSYDFWKSCFDRFITVQKDIYGACITIDFDTICFTPPSFESNDTGTQNVLSKWSFFKNASQAHHHGRPEDWIVVNEMTPLLRMAESKELKRLLTHPVIYAFVMVKWVRLSILHLLNLLLTMVTIGSFGWYSLSVCNVVDFHSYWHDFVTILIVLVIILTLLRYAIQLYLPTRSYAALENLVDISNIILMLSIFYDGCRAILSSLLLLVSVLRMLFMITEPFRKLSTIMYMFKTVAVKFFESLILFLPLISAFVFAFYLSYNSVNESSAVTESNRTYVANETNDEPNINKFTTVLTSVIKTVVMTTGEFDAADLDLTGGKVLLFFLFLFTAPMVILNLMNGLAVSDIAKIQEHSELISMTEKVIRLERIERMGVKVKPQWLKNWIPASFLKYHSSKIRVRIDQLGKILVRRKQKEESPQPNAEGNVATEPLLVNNSEQLNREGQIFSLPWFPPLFGEGTDKVVDLIIFRFTTFLTLDSLILAEALRVIGFKSVKTHSETKTYFACSEDEEESWS